MPNLSVGACFSDFYSSSRLFFSIFSFKLTEPTNALAATTSYSHAQTSLDFFATLKGQVVTTL